MHITIPLPSAIRRMQARIGTTLRASRRAASSPLAAAARQGESLRPVTISQTGALASMAAAADSAVMHAGRERLAASVHLINSRQSVLCTLYDANSRVDVDRIYIT